MPPPLNEAFSLAGKVAVITGGASGIGAESAHVLAQAGAAIMLADLNETKLSETAATINAAGGRAILQKCDVARRADVDAVAAGTLSALGRIDIWVNSAGVVVHKPILEVEEADLDFQIAVNLKGVYWGCVAAGRAMSAQGSGSIINISSTGAEMISKGTSVYAMTKSAVNACTRACAVEFGPAGVRVNAIGPGFIYTPLTRAAQEQDPVRREAMLQAVATISPLGITGMPIDIALAVLYLASDAARFVTGQILRPNGGASML